MDKRARSSVSPSIGAIDQSAELAEAHQHIGNDLSTPTPQQPWRLETLGAADKFARMAQTSAHFHWLVPPPRHRNPDEVTHWLRSVSFLSLLNGGGGDGDDSASSLPRHVVQPFAGSLRPASVRHTVEQDLLAPAARPRIACRADARPDPCKASTGESNPEGNPACEFLRFGIVREASGNSASAPAAPADHSSDAAE
jgi:hypothetical protein